MQTNKIVDQMRFKLKNLPCYFFTPPKCAPCVMSEKILLELIANLFMAQNAPRAHKEIYLLKADAQLKTLSLYIRMYMEFEVANQTRLYQIQSLIREAGSMLGGWLRASHNQ